MKKTSQIVSRVFFALCPVVFGLLIYICFRPHDQLLYMCFPFLDGLYLTIFMSKYNLPDWFVYNLPDGLWLLSYVYLIQLIFKNDIKRQFVYSITLYLMICGIELLQFFRVLPGTGDVWDIVAYTIPVVMILITNYKNYKSV